jgi:hypothetical protein
LINFFAVIIAFLCWFSGEVVEPVIHHLEPLWLQPVNARSPAFLVHEQTGVLKNAQMSSGRLPGVFKDARDFACGHRAFVEIHGQQHSAAGGMRQRAEDGTVEVQLRLSSASHVGY